MEGSESLLSFRYRSIPARPNSSRARRGNKGHAVSRSITSGSATVQVSPLVSIVAWRSPTLNCPLWAFQEIRDLLLDSLPDYRNRAVGVPNHRLRYATH